MTNPAAQRFSGQVAIVTGGARGIGLAIAERLAQEGAATVIADIDRCEAELAAASILREGGRAQAIEVDVANRESVARLMRLTVASFGTVDVLVNNAGIGSNCPFLDTSLDEWDSILRVNLTGTFLCAQAAAALMAASGSGSIVNIASVSGQRGGQGRAAYGCSKAGVILLTRVMSVELSALGIRVNALCPGPVDTAQSQGTHTHATRQAYYDRLPMGRYGVPTEIASAVAFLASSEASFISGEVLNADGGFNAAGLMFDPNE